MSPAKIAISLLITILVGTQALFSFKPPHRFRYWPFLSYPMYNNPHAPDEAVANYLLVGILKNGTEVPLSEKELGLNFWRYLKGPVRMAQRDDVHGLLAALQPFELRTHVTLHAVRLENRPVRVIGGEVTTLPTTTRVIVLRPGA